MHDTRLEDHVRQALRDEGARMSLSVSVTMLQERLDARRREARRARRWFGAAAVAVIAIGGGVAAVSQFQGIVAPTGASPDPSASHRVLLPDSSSLLAGFPDATLRLEHAVGPADGPLSSSASPIPGISPARIEVGRVRFLGPFVIGVACLGEGEIVVEVTTPSLGPVSYTQAIATCDGKPVHSEYLSQPIDPGSDGDIVTVTVSAGTSWRMALGEYPASLLAAPDFDPIALTEGWSLVSNSDPMLVSSSTGARVTMPEGATRAGVFVQCLGTGSLSVSVTGSAPTEVDCMDAGATQRIEFPAVGGEPLSVAATIDATRLWVRLIVEANGEIGSTYPTAPPLPADVATAPYVAVDASVVGFGTIGSNRQTILPIQGARPGRPAGDLLPIAVSNETAGARLDLASVSGGAVVATLVKLPAPSFIFDSWVDATHQQVFYGVANETAVEFHRIAIDGTGDQIVATIDRSSTSSSANLAMDDSVLVIGACSVEGHCVRTIVDAATGSARVVDPTGDPVCRILGIVDGLIVGTSRPVCSTESTTAVVAVPVEGGSPRVLMDDAPMPEIGSAIVVSLSTGPHLVYTEPVQTDGAVNIHVLDITNGLTAALQPSDVGDPRLIPYDVRLPEGWVLLAGGALGDFPWQRSIDRPAPVLADLVTGERIELVNLPHWTGNLR